MTSLTFALHPGHILRDEFMRPHALSASALARKIGVPRSRIEALVREDRSLTADTALRLSRLFGTSAEFWLNMQTAFDLSRAASEEIDAIAPLEVA